MGEIKSNNANMTKAELAYKIMFDLDGDMDMAVEIIDQFMMHHANKHNNVQYELEIDNASVISFEQFWNEYDKKVGYDKCKPKWNKMPMQDKILAMKYIPKYKEAQPNKKFRKNPETFLNNKGWLDEIIESKEVEKKTDFTGTDYTLQA